MRRLNIRTRAEWNSLPDNDKLDWLADDHRRRELDLKLLESLNKQIEKDMGTDLSAYYSLIRDLN